MSSTSTRILILPRVAANTLAEEYTQQNLDQRLSNNSKELAFVNEQLEAATLKVKLGEQSLQQYREVNNAQSLDDRQNIVVARLTSLSQAVTEKRTERQQKETLYNQVRGADPTSDTADTFPLIGNNPAVVTAQGQLATLKADRISLAQTYGPDAPKMREIEGKIDAAAKLLVAERRKVIDSARNEYEAAVAQERNFGSDLERANVANVELDRKSGDYRILQRDLDSQRQIFQSLLDRQKQLSVVANSRANNVRLMDRAEPTTHADLAQPATGLADGHPGRPHRRLRTRLRDRVPR